MVQVCQGIHSNKPNPNSTKYKQPEATSLPIDKIPSQERHIRLEYIIKLYTNDTGRFHVPSLIVNQYKTIAYHCDYNTIIAATFKSHANKHILLAHGAIMQKLKDRNILVELHILENEASTEYKRIIKYGE